MSRKASLVIFVVVLLIASAFIFLVPAIRTPNSTPPPPPVTPPPASVTGSGVFRSDDAGRTWQEKNSIGNGASTLSGVKGVSFAIDPSDPNTLLLGTEGAGLFASFDRGESWGRVSDADKKLLSGADILDIAIDPKNSGHWYIAVFQNGVGELLLTRDRGAHFESLYRVPTPRFGLFAVLVEEGGRHLEIITGEGAYLSSDTFGQSWKVLRFFRDGLVALFLDASRSSIRYVASNSGKLFRSANRGADWADVTPSFERFPGSKANQHFAIDKRGILYFASDAGLLRSKDQGATFARVPLIVPPSTLPMRAIAVNPKDTGHIVIAAANKLYETRDLGETWSELPDSGASTVTRVLFNSDDPRIMYLLAVR